MNNELNHLYPKEVWRIFSEILLIPRPSKKEERIIQYLKDFGAKYNLETLQDETGNILIRKPATAGYEHLETCILQSHVDMVCEKNADKKHDFLNDPIEAYIHEGWVKANGTTLGADDGIGMAAQLALLASDNIPHGPIECLFTVDEETGLTGAFGLKQGWLKGKILLNLDSEDEGELFIGCAGGVDTTGEIPLKTTAPPENLEWYKVTVSGLTGGHSGDDIHKGRANAVKLMNRFLWNLTKEYGIKIGKFDGGNLRNAIAREAFSEFCCSTDKKENILSITEKYNLLFKKEYKTTEPDLLLKTEPVQISGKVFDNDLQHKLLNALYACPHGVYAMSSEIPGFVETSTNLASVKTMENGILITTSQRSSVETAKTDIRDMVASTLRLGSALIKHSDGYPGWSPNPDSAIVKITGESYKKLFKTNPKVLAIHAGLECGLIGSVYPGMDMISFGPTIKGAHSPDERLEISTVQKFWDLLLDVLIHLPVKK